MDIEVWAVPDILDVMMIRDEISKRTNTSLVLLVKLYNE